MTEARLAAALLAAAAALLALPAGAEGGLPGSLRTIGSETAAAQAPAARPPEVGGAVFSPFAEAASTPAPLQGRDDAAGSGGGLTAWVTGLGVMAAAIAWMLRRAR